MTTDRIKEIQSKTAYPESVSVQQALLQVWNECEQEQLRLHFVSGGWVCVNEETPPNDIELLAKAPDGTIHLTSWRPAYYIFSCQCKSESAFDWQWKLV